MAKKGKITYEVKNMDSVFNAVKAVYNDLAKERRELDSIAKFARDRIVAETRKGKDLSRDRKQPPLSPNYIKYRERVARGEEDITPDGQFFSPKRSTLTLTGQLLDNIEYSVKPSQNKITIEPTGLRRDGLTNKEVASDLARRDRTFLGLDERGFARIRNRIVEAIRRLAIKKGL